MVEERPLVIHFARSEEHALSQETVDGEPQIRCDASRDGRLFSDEARAIILSE